MALLNFIVGPRTGLEGIFGFSIPHNALLYKLMTYCRHNPIEEILGLPDVVERVNAYQYQKEISELQLVRCSTVHGNLVVADLREEDPIYTCNRFLIYALNPECNISMHLMPGTEEGTTTISVGKSILDRSSKTNIGSLVAGIRRRWPQSRRRLQGQERGRRGGRRATDRTYHRRRIIRPFGGG